MKYVYLIQSINDKSKRYVGMTSDLVKRLATHNRGGSIYTKTFKPWRLITYIGFTNEDQAVKFEQYLKTSSGRAFSNKRLW